VTRIRTNTLALGSSFFFTAFLAFLQVKILTNSLDQTSFGVWSAVVAVGALLASVSEMGLPWTLVRYGAKFGAEGRTARLASLYAFALRVFVFSLSGVVFLLLLVGPGIAGLLGGGPMDRSLLILGYLTISAGSLRAFNNASFRGLRSMPSIAGIEISLAFLVTLAYFIFRNDLTVARVLTITLVLGLTFAVVGMVLLRRLFRGVPRPEPPDMSPILPEIRHFWIGAAVSGILLISIEQLDKPILATLVSFQELAIFHVAARLSLFARRLIAVPFQVMNPEVTHKWESHRRDELTRDMELFTKLALGLGLSMVVFLAVFARPLLLLISSPEFLEGVPVLWVFTAVIPLLCLHQPLVMFLRATGKVWYASASDVTWLLVYLGLGSVLVGSFGLPGFVAGQVAASLIILVYNLWIFGRLGLPRPPRAFFAKRVLLAVVVWGGSVTMGSLLPHWPVWGMALLGLVLALLGNFFVVRGRYLSPQEEDRVIAMLVGRGAAGRAARFLLTWPHGGVPGTSGRR